MSRRLLLGCRIGAAVLATLAGASSAGAAVNRAEELFDAAGYTPERTPFMQLPYEHIDPLTGNVMLTFTDLVLPGNAGFDLKFQRTYNSKIRNGPMNQVTVDDSWAGLGWTFHFGRVIDPLGADPVIEMPDGSRHEAWRAVASGLFTNADFITKDFWRFRPQAANVVNPPTLELPSGVKYTFAHVTPKGLYATRIEDTFGNFVTISYAQGGTGGAADPDCAGWASAAAHDAICKVTQDLGSGQTRVVRFTATGSILKTLATMTYAPLGTWTYTQMGAGGVWDLTYNLLTNVVPPTGGAGWAFGYYMTSGSGELQTVTTPFGGSIEYAYAQKTFYYGSSIPYQTRVVTSRISRDRAGLPNGAPQGTWTYLYPQDLLQMFPNDPLLNKQNKSRHISPSGVETTYEFYRIGPTPPADPPGFSTMWATGLLMERSVRRLGELQETEGYGWAYSDILSDEPFTYFPGGTILPVHAALSLGSTVVRGNGYSETSHCYRGVNTAYCLGGASTGHFNDYGRPFTTRWLNPHGDRQVDRVFHPYTFTRYIADRVTSQTVSRFLSDPYTESWTYDTSAGNEGFVLSHTRYGVTTTFHHWPGFRGNPEKSVDANNETTHYGYEWGVLESVDTPQYVIHQTINAAGTVAEQWRGSGSKTLYTWDGMGRLLTIDPPAGNTTTFTYDNSGTATSWSRSRGQSSLTTQLDGFGRPIETANAVGIQTRTKYDSSGRVEFESYPFNAQHGGADKGVTYTYDPLDRVILKKFPDTAAGVNQIVIDYFDPQFPGSPQTDGISRWITDEDGKRTKYTYGSWGGFNDPFLVEVRDANFAATSYQYNPLGRLTSVGGVGGPRTFHYNSKDQLDYEIHPESGQTDYTYTATGMVETRTDSRSVVATYEYDGNERVETISYNTNGVDDLSFTYNDYDQRLTVGNSVVGTTYVYDNANRLRYRTDDFTNGPAFTTEYVPDGNDNIGTIVYPSGMTITYTYDEENRLELVRRNGQTLASGFKHHPSGALLEYQAGNGIVHTLTYDERYRQKSYSSGSVLSFTLGLSRTGNVTEIDDTRNAFDSPLLEYDQLHRLTSVQGFGARSYTYDSAGNRMTATVNGQTTDYVYEQANTLRLDKTKIGSQVTDDFSWHLNGLLNSDNFANYAYSGRDMLLKVDPKNGTPDTDYGYDGDNQRATRTKGTEKSFFIHGGRGELLAEHVRCSTSTPAFAAREYIFAGSRLLAGTDHATKPVVSFQSASQSLFEPAGTQSLPVRLTTWNQCPTTEPVTVPFAATGITAIPSDWTGGSGSLVFDTGTAHGAIQNVSFGPVNDALVEPDETFKIDLQPPTGGIVGTIGTHTVTIRDDDGTVALTSAAVTIGEAGPQVTFTARRTNSNGQASSNQLPVNYVTTNGSAVSPGDYTHQAGTLLFDTNVPNLQELSFSVPIINDSLVECSETFTASISLANPVIGALGSPASSVATITDNDIATLSVLDVSVTEGNSGTSNAIFNIVANQAPCGTATVPYQTANGTAVAGGTYPDYQAVSGVVTITGTSGTVAVPVVGDTIHEDANQTFQLQLLNPATNATILDGLGIGAIQDNDAPATYSISGSPWYAEGDQGVTQASFTINRAGNLSEPAVAVNYLTADGTALGSSDYVPTGGQVTFPPFSTASQQVNVGIRGDSLAEGEETFYVNIGVANPLYGTANPSSFTARIQDDDPASLSSTEMFHGFGVEKTLTTCYPSGDWYRLGQSPYSSYEVVTDATGGGEGFVSTQRYKGVALTSWGPGSVPVAGNTWSRSLRWMNDSASSITNEAVQAHRTGGVCAGTYRYRLRSFDTTYSIARFNNTSNQVTSLLIQNNSNESVSGKIYFWSDTGALLATENLSITPTASVAPKALYVLVTSSNPALANQSGSITIANTGRYGALSGKAVTLEPLAGTVYETPLESRK